MVKAVNIQITAYINIFSTSSPKYKSWTFSCKLEQTHPERVFQDLSPVSEGQIRSLIRRTQVRHVFHPIMKKPGNQILLDVSSHSLSLSLHIFVCSPHPIPCIIPRPCRSSGGKTHRATSSSMLRQVDPEFAVTRSLAVGKKTGLLSN